MKKLLFFLMLGAVALGIAGCNPDEPNSSVIKGDTDHLSNFEVTIADATARMATIRVKSADQNIYYTAFFDPAAMAPKITRNFIEGLLQSLYGDKTYPYGLVQVSSTSPAHQLQPNTRYVVYVFAVKEGYKVDGDVEYMFFTTPEE